MNKITHKEVFMEVEMNGEFIDVVNLSADEVLDYINEANVLEIGDIDTALNIDEDKIEATIDNYTENGVANVFIDLGEILRDIVYLEDFALLQYSITMSDDLVKAVYMYNNIDYNDITFLYQGDIREYILQSNILEVIPINILPDYIRDKETFVTDWIAYKSPELVDNDRYSNSMIIYNFFRDYGVDGLFDYPYYLDILDYEKIFLERVVEGEQYVPIEPNYILGLEEMWIAINPVEGD